MSKYLSFSLWGNNPLYNIGAIRNAELWKTIYPDWKMILYYNDTVPKETIDKLVELDVLTIKIDDFDYGYFWRFFASDIPDCEYSIFRDTTFCLCIFLLLEYTIIDNTDSYFFFARMLS
jgi:hypothetical protein